ncbi:MAG: prolipoprotein diacylglyceryl transferase [Bacilli bacterium]|nr:prolipoprotein diacylglyceryl transferase [Bacilli bacterium]MDD4808671.1 prolipoprotein diacylglyceryl transferase [Bacilli bacterium]
MFDTNIPLYSIMILLSLIVNIIVVLLIYKKYNFKKNEIIGALIYENMGIIIGAKLLTYIQHYKEYGEFNFYRLGLSAYGGVIGAIMCLIIFGIKYKKSFKDMFFTFMPSIPIMYAIGKIGCFLVGCCHGIEYSGFGSVVYNHSLVAPAGVSLFPIQIVETLVFTLIFIYMFNRTIKNRFNWQTLGISFILCGLAKFSLDFLRISHVDKILSLNQIISIVFIIIGALLIIKNKKTL